MKNKVVKGLLISAVSLPVCFFALALPFRLLGNMSDHAMEVLFMTELLVYLGAGLLFLTFQEKRNKEKEKAEKRHCKRRAQIMQFQRDWMDLAA